MQQVLVARHAMATRFEIVLHGEDSSRLRTAGEEALDEIERIEHMLSVYDPTSEIANLNGRAAREAVRVSPETFSLLDRAMRLSRATAGAFDITVGPLMRCWGLMGKSGRVPDAQELANARECVGMHLVRLDSATSSVRFEHPGVKLDLGAIGKGYAVECAIEIVRDAGVTSAFIHGGTSTAYGLGYQPGGEPWKVAIDRPQRSAGAEGPPAINVADEPATLATVTLTDEALSVSAPSGKSFQIGDSTYGHVIDPRTGSPTAGAALAAVVVSSATDSDALSTALLVLGVDGSSAVTGSNSEVKFFVANWSHDSQSLRARAREIPVASTRGLLLID